jgi:2-polyprenyl-3-methyl-5-hydroxy-6-metoxy-1,4-benzoquinol methylase
VEPPVQIEPEKPPGYYANDRAELVRQLPQPLGRVLDVGCGEGRAAAPLRAAGAEWISGVELHEPSAAAAATSYDEVVTGRVEDALDRLAGPFDTILAYDVLEHLPDPRSVLVALGEVAATAARLHVSVPNARHHSLVKDLLLHGTFGYTAAGHRDETHLRWFTRRDLEALLAATGWAAVPHSHPALLGKRAWLHRLTGGRLAELTFWQWVVLAYRREAAPDRS